MNWLSIPEAPHAHIWVNPEIQLFSGCAFAVCNMLSAVVSELKDEDKPHCKHCNRMMEDEL